MNQVNLRFLQIQVTKEQAKFLPGVALMDNFDSVEFISTISTSGNASVYVLCAKYDAPEDLDYLLSNAAFELKEIIEQHPKWCLFTAKVIGPLMMLVHNNDMIWLQTPTALTRSAGLFMTIHGTTTGLKRFRDDVAKLLPASIKIRISKDLKADWIAAPQLSTRRKEVMNLAVEMGYYSTPRKCTQRDLAVSLGVRQGTVAEHLQSAESMIITSWADQSK